MTGIEQAARAEAEPTMGDRLADVFAQFAVDRTGAVMNEETAECERIGHDDEITYQDEEVTQYVCARCGAELEDGEGVTS